jgi:diadenosine tetraphosphate (Ap4A) HIT family hydrolase
MFIQERLNEFYDKSMDSEYREHWTQKAIEHIAEGYALGLNENWIVARLENCDYQSIHTTIINKCRDKLDFWQTDEEDKKVINAMLERHKRELYALLTSDIYNYCVR